MRVTFEKQTLCKALETVQRAAQNKVTSNVNNGFYIAAENGKAVFQANDYSIGIKTSCAAEVEEEGYAVIAAPQLLTTLRMMPSGMILMEKKKESNMVSFSQGTYKAEFPVRGGDFPDVETVDPMNHCKVRCKDLAEMTNLVSYAASTDKMKPFFTGVLFEIKGAVFSMAATNTHRLACKDISLDEEAPNPGRFIVPANVLSDVCRLLPQEEEEMVEITWIRNHVAFAFGDTYFVSALINGEYPDYHRVIPKSFDTDAVVNLRDFAEAVRFVSPISMDANYQTINFYFHEDTLEIYEEAAEVGRSDTSIPVKLSGNELRITFNCKYIEDILKHSKGETVTLHLQNAGAMLVEQEEDKTYQYVVTPMRGRN